MEKIKAIKIVLSLINKSFKGELLLNDLYNLWPEILAEEELYETIFNDLEAVIEHFPGKVWGAKSRDVYFKKTKEYKALQIDREIVSSILAGNNEIDHLLILKKNIYK